MIRTSARTSRRAHDRERRPGSWPGGFSGRLEAYFHRHTRMSSNPRALTSERHRVTTQAANDPEQHPVVNRDSIRRTYPFFLPVRHKRCIDRGQCRLAGAGRFRPGKPNRSRPRRRRLRISIEECRKDRARPFRFGRQALSIFWRSSSFSTWMRLRRGDAVIPLQRASSVSCALADHGWRLTSACTLPEPATGSGSSTCVTVGLAIIRNGHDRLACDTAIRRLRARHGCV